MRFKYRMTYLVDNCVRAEVSKVGRFINYQHFVELLGLWSGGSFIYSPERGCIADDAAVEDYTNIMVHLAR